MGGSRGGGEGLETGRRVEMGRGPATTGIGAVGGEWRMSSSELGGGNRGPMESKVRTPWHLLEKGRALPCGRW